MTAICRLLERHEAETASLIEDIGGLRDMLARIDARLTVGQPSPQARLNVYAPLHRRSMRFLSLRAQMLEPSLSHFVIHMSAHPKFHILFYPFEFPCTFWFRWTRTAG